MEDIQNMNLEDAIKLYSVIIAEDVINGRVEVHERICELLEVNKETFNPFELWALVRTIHDPKHAEFLIRHRIKEIKNAK